MNDQDLFLIIIKRKKKNYWLSSLVQHNSIKTYRNRSIVKKEKSIEGSSSKSNSKS